MHANLLWELCYECLIWLSHVVTFKIFLWFLSGFRNSCWEVADSGRPWNMVDCGHYLISHWDADSSRWKQLGAVLLNIKGEQLSHRQTSGVNCSPNLWTHHTYDSWARHQQPRTSWFGCSNFCEWLLFSGPVAILIACTMSSVTNDMSVMSGSCCQTQCVK